jgi:hypothetical protein
VTRAARVREPLELAVVERRVDDDQPVDALAERQVVEEPPCRPARTIVKGRMS